jgi:hypothetical protein
MKKLILVAVMALIAAPIIQAPAEARDLGPQRESFNVSVSNSVVGIPQISETGRFTPQWMLFRNIPAGCTQAVSYVVGGITSTYAAATTVSILAISNVPTMFYGDKFIVVPSATVATNTPIIVTPIGTVFD